MMTFRILVLAMAIQASLAMASGTERGGGTSPAPIFMPEDVIYQCRITLTQSGESIQIRRPLVSYVDYSVEWKKGEFGGRRGVDLNQMTAWKHFELKQIGPVHFKEVEVASAPVTAKFEGFLAFSVERLRSPAELGVVLTTGLLSGTAAEGNGVSEAYSAETIRSRANLIGNVRYVKRDPAGDHDDERSLLVRCVRGN